MTERKPAGMSFRTWIDQQIEQAQEQGAFDDLPGAGKPIPGRGEPDDGQSWLRNYLRREGVPAQEMLPPPLRLRKETELLAESVHELESEQEVREAVADLNHRVIEFRRIPVGPPVFVPLADEEAIIARWRAGRAAAPDPSPAGADGPGGAAGTGRFRWWRRPRRRRRP